MRLSEYARSRDNNFTLLRLIAAFTVVLAHSGPILGNPGTGDFVFWHIGRGTGEMALDMLFVTSGFLVTASLFNRGDLNHFLWARALRLYPALWLMLPVTVLLIAPALTSLSLQDYYGSKTTWEYLVRGMTVLWGMRYSLPGVFDVLPLKGEFNGSLWTLPVEARMYIYLAVGWIAFAWAPRIRVRALSFVAPVAAAIFYAVVLRANARGAISNADVAIFMFFYGASFYFWRDRLFINRAIFVGLPILVVAAATIDRSLAFAVYLLCVAPFLLCLAYIPGGRIRAVNRWGDYSYGIYIYAFPVQQTLAMFFPKLSIFAMATGAGLISWALAFCSWNLVEKRAMGMKDACANATMRVFDHGLERAKSWIGQRSSDGADAVEVGAKPFAGDEGHAPVRADG